MAIVSPAPERPGATLTPEAALAVAGEISSGAAKRLRVYFQHPHRPANVLAEGTDLELSARGLIIRMPPTPFSSAVSYWITPDGERVAAALREISKVQRAPHHQLGSHLSKWLRDHQGRVTWENIEMLAEVNGKGRAVRPDIFAIVSTLQVALARPAVFEIKVSRADFLCDVRDPDKRAGYFSLAPQVYYATPHGLVTKDEIPKECGWIEQQTALEWRIKKAAPVLKSWAGLSSQTLLTLAIKSGALPTPPNAN